MKKKKWKRMAALLIATTLLGTTTACSESEEVINTEVDDDTLRIAMSTDFNTIDILIAYAHEINMVVNAVTEGLFYYDENSVVQPYLAESYEQVDDVTYVYQIREGVTFSDGTELTAEDVVFSLEYQRDEENASLLSWMFDNVDTIEQTGDYEVTVTLSTPDPTWVYTLATPAGNVISKSYYEAHSDNFGTAEGGFIGTGPYVITDWSSTEVDLEYNEDYWNAANTEVDFKKVQFLSVKDQAVSKTLLESGDVDIVSNLSVDGAKELDGKNGISIKKVDMLLSTFVSFNTTVEPLNDVRVRQAIAYAIDKEAILNDIVGEEYGSLAKSFPFSEKIGEANAEIWGDYFETQNTYEKDIEKAKELLEEAGYGDGLSFVLSYDASNSVAESEALYIQQSLAEINITITLEGLDSGEISTQRYGGSETRTYELLITKWGSDYPDPTGCIIPMYVSTNNVAGGSNWAEYVSEDFDRLISESNAATSEEERIAILKEALDILQEEIPYAPIVNDYIFYGHSSRVDYEYSTMCLYNIYIKDIKRAE